MVFSYATAKENYKYVVILTLNGIETSIDFVYSKYSKFLNRVLFRTEFNKNDFLFVIVPSGDMEQADLHTQLKEVINTKQPNSILLMGHQSVNALFPNAPRQANTTERVRGNIVPFFTDKGIGINCVVTYNVAFFTDTVEDTHNADLKFILKDDISLLRNETSIKDVATVTPKIVICTNYKYVRELSNRLKTESIVAFDYETSSLKPYNKAGKKNVLHSASFAFDDGTSYAIPLHGYYPSNMQKAIFELLGHFHSVLNKNQVKVAHNTKFDMIWGMIKTGCDLKNRPRGVWEDSSLLCWLSDGRPGMSRLKVAAWAYLGVDDWGTDVTDVSRIPLATLLNYNALDAFYTLRLYQFLKKKNSKNKDMVLAYNELLLPAMLQFLKIEIRGVPISEEKRDYFYNEYKEKLKKLEQVVVRTANIPNLNPSSSKQLQNYFVNIKKYKLKKKTKTGWSMDTEALEYISATFKDELAKSILQYREINKLQNTYIVGIGKHIYDDSRLHASYNLTSTVTGRTSCSDPNMQNFPKRKSKEVRSMITAPDGYKLCSFDYGQIEARLFAVVTGDAQYLEDLHNGYDIHMEKALWVYRDNLGLTQEEAEGKRHKIKNGGVFPAFYGAGDTTISLALDIPLELASEFKQSIFDRYPTIKKWQKEIATYEKRRGYITSLFGRRRRSPMRYNELLNFVTQSTASDMTLYAMNYIGRKYEVAFMIHDDLSIFIKDDDNLKNNLEYIANAMLCIPWTLLSKSSLLRAFAPLQVDCEVGDNWATQEKVFSLDSVETNNETLQKSVLNGEKYKKELAQVGW